MLQLASEGLAGVNQAKGGEEISRQKEKLMQRSFSKAEQNSRKVRAAAAENEAERCMMSGS